MFEIMGKYLYMNVFGPQINMLGVTLVIFENIDLYLFVSYAAFVALVYIFFLL